MARDFDATAVMQRVLADTGLTIAEFAFRVGKHPATIERWRNGRTNPGERTVATALRVLGVDPAKYGVAEPATRIQQPVSAHDHPATQPEWALRLESKLDEVLRLLRREA